MMIIKAMQPCPHVRRSFCLVILLMVMMMMVVANLISDNATEVQAQKLAERVVPARHWQCSAAGRQW
jgi:hypothetical protein